MQYVYYSDPIEIRIGIPGGRSAELAKTMMRAFFLKHFNVLYISEDCFPDINNRKVVGSPFFVSKNGLFDEGNQLKCTVMSVKPKDIAKLLLNKMIDLVFCFDDVMHHIEIKQYNLKPLFELENDYSLEGGPASKICLVGRKDDSVYHSSPKVFTEYEDITRKLSALLPQYSKLDIQVVTGSLEGYVASGVADYGVTIVQTGKTLDVNNIKVISEIRTIHMNAWLNTNSNCGYWLYRLCFPTAKVVFLDGIDGSGKTSTINALLQDKDLWNIVFVDRSPLTKLTLKSTNLEWMNNVKNIVNDLEESYFKTVGDETKDVSNNSFESANISTIQDEDELQRVYEKLSSIEKILEDINYENYPPTINKDNEIIIVVTSEKSCERIMKRENISWKNYDSLPPSDFHSRAALNYFNHRYRTLACKYGLIFAVNNHSHKEFIEYVKKICLDDDFKKNNEIPRVDDLDMESFNKLTPVAKGESKDIRVMYGGYYHVLYLIPSIYTHKHGCRHALIPGSGVMRNAQMRQILDIFAFAGISHTYNYVGKQFILIDALDDNNIPPIEVVAKSRYEGTDKFRLVGLNKYKNVHTGKEIVEENGIYSNGPYIRFDWRNSNDHKEGDVCCPLPIARQFFKDIKGAEKLALDAFSTLRLHYSKIGIDVWDCCFFVTSVSDKIFGEITADCARYKYDPRKVQTEYRMKISNSENDNDSLDKDQWRSRGADPRAPQIVLAKSIKLLLLLSKYTHTYFSSLYSN